MSRGLDYSKWDHIEISDDEDDTHPNVDTASLFRWRHQARLDRMTQRDREWEEVKKGKDESTKKMRELESKMKSQSLSPSEIAQLETSKEELKRQEEEFKKKENELLEKDKATPWNVDTICKEGFSKSIINKKENEDKDEELSEEDFLKKQKEYQDKHEKHLKQYGMLSKPEESKKFLQSHPELICEKAANFLVIWCVDLEVEEKTSLMERVAHQTIILQFILQLAKSMKADPRDCYIIFFNKFSKLEADYMKNFTEELDSFKGRIKERAQVRIDEAIKRYEEEEREKQLGPGGLHPQDVMETLPQELRDCFESRDISNLQKVISEMDRNDAAYHMKRCVDAGLWVPAKEDDDDDEEEDDEEEEGGDGDGEGTYETPQGEKTTTAAATATTSADN